MAQGRLLILDDDPMVGQLLVYVAQSVGLATRLTDDPEAFLATAASWDPSHVAVDLHMPAMNGLDVLRALAASGSRAKVIVSSGADVLELQEAIDEARSLGLDTAGSLAKPFSTTTLKALLDEP